MENLSSYDRPEEFETPDYDADMSDTADSDYDAIIAEDSVDVDIPDGLPSSDQPPSDGRGEEVRVESRLSGTGSSLQYPDKVLVNLALDSPEDLVRLAEQLPDARGVITEYLGDLERQSEIGGGYGYSLASSILEAEKVVDRVDMDNSQDQPDDPDVERRRHP